MTQKDIKHIIDKGEGLRIEFKEANDTVPDSFYETVVSFSNKDGGTILLGVADDGSVKGINEEYTDKLQRDIITTLNSRNCINPPLYVRPIILQHPDGLIIVIQIQASSQVHDHAGKIYIREFESDINITQNQNKISELYLRKRNFFTEANIFPHLSMTDFNPVLFDKARNLIRNFRSDHPWLLVNNDQMMKDSILWKKDFSTGQKGYTLAAALIFGKDQTIQSLIPAYKVEAMVRIQNKDRWDDRITLRKNLIDTYLELKQFISKYLPEKFYMEGDQRIDLRDKIFREVIGNIIVHREYTSALSTDLIITDTTVTVTNPNKPLFHGPIDPAGFNPYPKNPNIRKFFTAFGWTDEIGSGIRNTYKYMPLYIHGAKPAFIEDDTFITQIPLQWLTLAAFTESMLSWLQLSEDSFTHLEKGLSSIPLPSILAGQTWEDILLYLVPSWHQKGTQLLNETWPDNQPFTKQLRFNVPGRDPNGTQLSEKGTKMHKEISADYLAILKNEIRKVPGWRENSTRLFQKKSWYLISVLCLTSEPIKLSDLLNVFGYKNEKSFRDKYIKPLRQENFIRFTNPETPTDPENKYEITEKGRNFIGGIIQ